MVRPAQNQFTDLRDLDPSSTLEVQYHYQWMPPVGAEAGNYTRPAVDYAVVSIVMTSQYPNVEVRDEQGNLVQRQERYLPSGEKIVGPLYTLGNVRNFWNFLKFFPPHSTRR